MNNNLKSKIKELKEKKNAIILAHYYTNDDIQEIADYVGDSYYLSEIARDSKENTIVFCGVTFMGESAKVLSPQKKVLMPSKEAGCFMADMATKDMVLEYREKYKDATFVCYINSSYDVKAYCDVAVTSSSALNIIKNIENNKIVFLPDKNLGSYIAEFFPEKEFILWNGCCPCHMRITKESILKEKNRYPNAEILVHGECTKEVRDMADYIGSTKGIINYATKSDKKEFIIGTERGILYELNKKNKDKKFIIPGGDVTCINMKKIELTDVYETLLNESNQVVLDEDIRTKAVRCLENMHKLNK